VNILLKEQPCIGHHSISPIVEKQNVPHLCPSLGTLIAIEIIVFGYQKKEYASNLFVAL
jgi:hypothetical protein